MHNFTVKIELVQFGLGWVGFKYEKIIELYVAITGKPILFGLKSG